MARPEKKKFIYAISEVQWNVDHVALEDENVKLTIDVIPRNSQVKIFLECIVVS